MFLTLIKDSSNQGSLSRNESIGEYHEKSTIGYRGEPQQQQQQQQQQRPVGQQGPPTIRLQKPAHHHTPTQQPTQQPIMRPPAGLLGLDHSFVNQSGFSTIRPMTLMKKEKEELPTRSAFREQMGNYKKLRQEHRRTMMELESKLEKEMENHQRNLQNELHRQRRKHDDDRLKQARKRHAHLEKLQREDENEERLFERHLDQKEEKEKNELDEVHRSEMKKGKNARMAQNERQRLAVHHSDQRNQLEREQRQAHEMELRKWKRRRLICECAIC